MSASFPYMGRRAARREHPSAVSLAAVSPLARQKAVQLGLALLSNETHFVGLSFEGLRLAAAHSLRSHVCEPKRIFSDAHVAGENDPNYLRLRAQTLRGFLMRKTGASRLRLSRWLFPPVLIFAAFDARVRRRLGVAVDDPLIPDADGRKAALGDQTPCVAGILAIALRPLRYA